MYDMGKEPELLTEKRNRVAGLDKEHYVRGFHHCPILAEAKLEMYGIVPPLFPEEKGNLQIIDLTTGDKLFIDFIKFCPFCGLELKPIKIRDKE
jgi:hypothetical protein